MEAHSCKPDCKVCQGTGFFLTSKGDEMYCPDSLKGYHYEHPPFHGRGKGSLTPEQQAKVKPLTDDELAELGLSLSL